MIPLNASSGIIIAGTTGSGKTHLTYNILQHSSDLFDKPPGRFLYCYSVYQPFFAKMEESIPNLKFYKGMPTEKLIEELSSEQTHSILVIDDLGPSVMQSPLVERIFAVDNHHRGITTILILQNMFQQGKCARGIALNAHYIFMLKNVRGRSQLKCLGHQLFPNKGRLLEEVYDDCMKKAYGYLLIDLSPHTEDKYRLRTDIFPHEKTVVYTAI